MKKVVLLAAVICGLCSCIKNETVLPSSEQYREIALKPFNSKSAMRAPINGTTLPDDARLGVFAFYNGATPQKYFEDAMFGKKAGTDNTWAGITAAGASRPYYWPTSGSLDFFAYYPKTGDVGVQVTYDSDTNPTKIYGFTGIAIDISSLQYDLMYSDMLLNRTSKTAEVGGIPLTLHHALTQIVVNIKKTDATPKVVVTKVTVNNVFVKADGFHCSYIDGVDTTIKKAWTMWSWNSTNPGDERTPAFAIPNVQADTTTAAGKEGVEISTTLKQFGDGALIIPYPYPGFGNHQELECQTSLTIEYTFDNGGVESEVVHTIDLNKGITDVNAKARWEMAKKYTYNITIGLNQIEFEPTVDNWDDAAGKDINL